MIKNIKRVGIIFLAVAIICLMVMGCLSVNSVASNGGNVTGSNLNNEQNKISADVEDNVQKESASEEVVIPSADRVYTLTGDCDSMAEGWQKAVKESEETGSIVKVILGNNWTAKEDTEFTTSFGSGYAFDKGIIVVPVGCHIVLDLAGKTIDRALTSMQGYYGKVLFVYGTLEIIDSNYDMKNLYAEYDEILARATQSSWEGKRDFVTAELKKLPIGRITGANATNAFANSYQIGATINIATNATLNIYGGMFINNQGTHGGVLGAMRDSIVNIYNTIMLENTATADGGCIFSVGQCNIYNGLYINNTGKQGVFYATKTDINAVAQGTINFYDGIYSFNQNRPEGYGVMYAYKGGILNFYGGEISNNAGNSGIVVYNQASGNTINIAGGVIKNNTSADKISAFFQVVYSTNYGSDLSLSNCIIKDNLASTYGVISNNFKSISISGGVQIYNNIDEDGRERDIYLYAGKKLQITGPLITTTSATQIGIVLATNYFAEPFTNGYAVSGNAPNPSLYFYSTDDHEIDFDAGNREATEKKDTTSAAIDLTWKWTGGQVVGGSNMTVPYTGNDYVITATDINGAVSMCQYGVSNDKPQYVLRNAGSYVFFINGDGKKYHNSTFTFKIAPKEVDITWGTEKFVYNGSSQVLSAVVAGYPDCEVTVSGGKTQAGSGYMAIATALSDPNLKIRGTRQTKEFSIERAKINAPSGTQIFILDGNEHTYTPTTGWDNTKMAIVDNKATEAGVHKATIMLKDPVNYQWTTGGGRHIELEYTIEDKSIIKNNVYDFIYLEQNGDTILRKTFKEGKVYRMANDSDIISNNNDNKLIMGNIAPNTTVFEFMDNLKVETDKISIYNGSKVIIENGVVATGINESLLRDKNEMPIGTGWKVIVNHDNEQAEEIYLSVLGDITGDGKVNTADVNVIRQIVNDKAVFENIRVEAKLASLILNKGKLATNSDSQLLWEAACGRLDIADFI